MLDRPPLLLLLSSSTALMNLCISARLKMRANPACSSETEYMDCDTNTKFRKSDGTCNSLANPRLGSQGTQLKRLMPGIPNLFNVPTYLTKPVNMDSPGDVPGIPRQAEGGGEGEEYYDGEGGDYEGEGENGGKSITST